MLVEADVLVEVEVDVLAEVEADVLAKESAEPDVSVEANVSVEVKDVAEPENQEEIVEAIVVDLLDNIQSNNLWLEQVNKFFSYIIL